MVGFIGYSCDEFPVDIPSIQPIRTDTSEEKAESIKYEIPDVVIVIWDWKSLIDLNVRSSKEK